MIELGSNTFKIVQLEGGRAQGHVQGFLEGSWQLSGLLIAWAQQGPEGHRSLGRVRGLRSPVGLTPRATAPHSAADPHVSSAVK